MLKLNSIYFKKKDERKWEFKAMKTQILKIQFVLQRTQKIVMFFYMNNIYFKDE